MRRYKFYRAAPSFFKCHRGRHLSNEMAEKRASRGCPTDICSLSQKHCRPHACADGIKWCANLVSEDEYVQAKHDYTWFWFRTTHRYNQKI